MPPQNIHSSNFFKNKMKIEKMTHIGCENFSVSTQTMNTTYLKRYLIQ